LVVGVGDFHAKEVAKTQPTKFAAMESLWETTKDAPMYLLLVPDPANEKNSVEAIEIPKFLSILSGQKEVKGLKEFPPQDRPPVTITFISFRLMVVLGFLFIILAFLALIKFKKIEQSTTLLRILLWSIPLPYIAAQLGWIVAEVGRQPWIVYGLLRTADAISKAVEPAQVMASFVGFTIFYGALGVIDIYLLSKYARKGPETKEV
jgi:cytochrome d ubiquinol oxidase subunit I